ncbi:MAG TPA: hypothetical protein VFZ04_16520 [Longimicrobiales bacterium]
MKRLEHIAFLVVAGVLLLLLALFPLLTTDSIAKLFSRRTGLEAGNFALIFYLEVSRAFTTLVAVVAVVVLLIRSSRGADARALTLFLLFVGLTYEKIFGGIGYPGPMQEALTHWLLDHGVPRAGIVWLFGPVPWSIWLALAAIMRFSVVFPRPPLSAEIIDASAAHDRKGIMRGAGLAGMDIGAGFRRIAKTLLASGAFRPLPLWTTAIVLIVITTVLDRTARIILFATAASLVLALVITNLRASYNVVAPQERARMRWLVLGFLAAGALFVLASVPLLFMENPVTTVSALVLIMIAPAVIMICMAMAVIYRGPTDAGEFLERLPGWTAHWFALSLIFALVSAALRGAGIASGMSMLAGLVAAGALFRPLRLVTGRVVNRVLERPAT